MRRIAVCLGYTADRKHVVERWATPRELRFSSISGRHNWVDRYRLCSSPEPLYPSAMRILGLSVIETDDRRSSERWAFRSDSADNWLGVVWGVFSLGPAQRRECVKLIGGARTKCATSSISALYDRVAAECHYAPDIFVTIDSISLICNTVDMIQSIQLRIQITLTDANFM